MYVCMYVCMYVHMYLTKGSRVCPIGLNVSF